MLLRSARGSDAAPADDRFERDPPPDLCIEIDLRRTPIDKLGVYAALRVPELWHCDDQGRIEAMILRPRRKYIRSEKARRSRSCGRPI